MCTCKETCSFELYTTTEKLRPIKNAVNVPIYHTNFPVSLQAISNFKNPLGKVLFKGQFERSSIRDLLKGGSPNI